MNMQRFSIYAEPITQCANAYVSNAAWRVSQPACKVQSLQSCDFEGGLLREGTERAQNDKTGEMPRALLYSAAGPTRHRRTSRIST